MSDHATGFVDVQHQVSLSAANTIKAKLQFEREALLSGVHVSSYHTDNGVFTSAGVMQELLKKNQTISLSGVGAAHQNGIAEWAIKTVVSIARTMMLHAAMRSPDGTVTSKLWPMAMDHAVWIYNRIPKYDTGLSPLQHWTQSTFDDVQTTLSNLHVWGCPSFVLEPKLQKPGVKIPKWAPRSQQGHFMGFSKLHSTLIGLILNPHTGTISPQFHVVYDDLVYYCSPQ